MDKDTIINFIQRTIQKEQKFINLSRRKIIELPNDIENLINPMWLDLSNNDLIELPPGIGNLLQLSELDLSNNKLESLPSSLLQLKKLKTLNLQGNSLPIPPEILSKTQSPQAILDYYFTIVSESQKPINELKLLVVGQGSVGKTSLVQRILFGKYDQSQVKTEGISISEWLINQNLILEVLNSRSHSKTINFNNDIFKTETSIKLNVWDFGGQEIMHTTHQFFLTKRSLYLLVLDSRLTQEENRTEYWLKIIQSYGDNAPVLIVGNKIDQHRLDIDSTGLKKKYPNIIGILETSALTGTGIRNLKDTIIEFINEMPHVRDLLPTKWFAIKTELEELGQKSNFVTYDKYIDLCVENEINDEINQRALISFLHDLGVILHFQDNPRLESLGILNPQWVTNGVYQILNSHTLFQNKGVLTLSMLDEILSQPEYPRGKRLFIVDMMKKFELCYDLEPDKIFLVLDLLPKEEPKLNLNYLPAFEYVYTVPLSSVITRFIVRMNKNIDDGLVWRTGVVLKIGENRALIKADTEDRKITIAIDGLGHTRRDVLSAIRFQLDEIHGSIKGLNPERRVPIPDAPNAEPLEYEYLLMLEIEKQETHWVRDGTKLVKVNVSQILSAIETEEQKREFGANITNIYVGGNFDGNLTVGNGNQIIRDSYNKITSAKIDTELKDTLKQLADAVIKMNIYLSDAEATEVAENFELLANQATKDKPNKQWYSVSIDGLIKAAENVEKIGVPVINLSRKILSLLSGSVI